MRGYCESCGEEVESQVCPYDGADECPRCGDDVHPGIHVENMNDEDEDDGPSGFDEWLNEHNKG